MRRTIMVLTAAAAALLGAAAVAEEDPPMLQAGDTFPAFELTAHDGTTVSSGDLAGEPYLVYFYPKADTPGCTKEACAFRDRWEDVQAAGLTILGVSYDSPKANRAFAEKYALPFQLLSDSERDLASAVGAARTLLPVPKRISYLVGAEGRVLKAYPSVDVGSHAGEVLADLETLAAD